jgi:hypothetical protein
VDMKFPDDEALGAVLEPAGPWDKALAPEWRRSTKLLTDTAVPEEVRVALEEPRNPTTIPCGLFFAQPCSDCLAEPRTGTEVLKSR